MNAIPVDSWARTPSVCVDVAERDARVRRGWQRCEIGKNLKFDIERLESYFFAQWQPVLYDALLVAASVEFCDKSLRRPASNWAREIELRIPVHDPDLWNQNEVLKPLLDTLTFLTGDKWEITFYVRSQDEPAPSQGLISLQHEVSAVIPFSDGLDSRAVAGIVGQKLGDQLVRVRVSSTQLDDRKCRRNPQPFASVPYEVHPRKRSFVESSVRSRGFKFTLVSGIAAYLAQANRVIMSESGQGALGPSLVPVGQAYADYRSHPRFTVLMEKLFGALLNFRVQYEFPQLWRTKGETLAQFVSECEEGSASWASTQSCWQDNRNVSVENRKRQCGVCAACMLRRLSVHAAGLSEPKSTYVWENLNASTFESGAAAAFDTKKITCAMRQYAIAGTLHLAHLAEVRHSPMDANLLVLNAFQLSQACGVAETDVRLRLDRLLSQHEIEWKSFKNTLGAESFVTNWAEPAR